MVGLEASVLSAAVTGMLKIVSNKLAPLVIQEYSSIVGVEKDLQELQDLVQEINCHLETAGDRATRDAPWLKKLKEVAYDVDDVVDEFQLKVEKHDADGSGGFVSRYLHSKGESFIFQCTVAKKIKEIKERFSKIVKQRTDLTAIFGHDPVGHINKPALNMQTLPVGDEAAVLGRDQEMHQIISYLVETNDKQEIKIVSIVGLGGSGKTTLAKLVFNDDKMIENHFEVRLWVHVSQEFDFEMIIKKLYEAFADKDLGQPSLTYMSKRVQEGLTKKKFLIVMDDVWTESQIQWDKIMGYLKTGAPGSWILLTTRSKNVAEVVRSTYQLCLQPLSPDDSWQLFQQSFRMPVKFLEYDFVKVGKEIAQTCCGLPLAIKVLAGSLGDKELIGEWQAMRDILLDVHGEESLSACLKLSYFHLPSNIKRCFTMCSLFPKGHLISKQQLIDQWIVHDMISLTPGVDDLDHIGHRYFHSLVQVSFLQDVEEYDGRVRCKMHDLVHDLARSILCEEISTIVPASSTKGYRYFCLVEKPRKRLPKKAFEDSRAIYVHAGDDIIHGNALKNAKHLRSITVNYIISAEVLTAVCQVKNLKYLEISHLVCGELPEAISDILSLQTLYLTSWDLLKLPKSIGNLKKLRTLNLSWCCRLMSLPSSITNLENLEKLKLEKCNLLMLPRGIGNLTKLKELNSVCVGSDKRHAQISELATLSRLSGKLSICFLRRLTDASDARRACLKQKEKLDELELSWGSLYDKVNVEHEMAILDGLEPPSRIKRLKISAYGGLQFAWWMLMPVGGGAEGLRQFPFLTEMSLANFPNLKHLDGLVQLPCLEKLRLWDMPALESISGGPFPSLVKLKMYRLRSLGEVWMVTGRTLFGKSGQLQIGSHLANLYVEGCPKLEVKPYLPTSLEQLRLDSCNISLLSSPHQSEGSSSSSNFPPSYSHLKVLVLSYMKAAAALSPPMPPGLQSGCRLELLQHMPTLESLEIFHCHDLTELPERLGELCSLQKMTIKYCHSLGSLPQSIGYLTSLEKLEITKCNAFVKIPRSLCHLTTSLKELRISSCRGIKSLPQGIKGLTALQRLEIHECPKLVRWCNRYDWHLISHIPHLSIC